MSKLQADGTRFNLFYSADGCNGASQIHFCDAKIGVFLKIGKFITTFLFIRVNFDSRNKLRFIHLPPLTYIAYHLHRKRIRHIYVFT